MPRLMAWFGIDPLRLDEYTQAELNACLEALLDLPPVGYVFAVFPEGV